jgi:hypothetical protein
MLCEDPWEKAQVAGLFPVRGLPEALPHYCPSHRPITLGNCIYILDKRIAKSALVRRSYVFNWRKNCKARVTRNKDKERTLRVYNTSFNMAIRFLLTRGEQLDMAIKAPRYLFTDLASQVPLH